MVNEKTRPCVSFFFILFICFLFISVGFSKRCATSPQIGLKPHVC